MRRALALSALVLLPLAACGGGDDGGGQPAADAAPASRPDAAPCVPATTTTTFFVNRGGGSYTAGPDDAANNVSSVLNEATEVAAETIDDALWGEVLTCLRDRFAPFAVEITDVDPAPAAHREVLVSAAVVQGICGASCGGLSPAQCSNDGEDPVPNAIVMVRPPSYFQADATLACETYAQILATSYGLDHAFVCEDLLTFQTGCGEKSFLDQDVACGEFEARNCNCGGPTQNSYQTLLGFLGASCE